MAQIRRNGAYAPLSSTYYMDDAVISAGADAEILFARSLAFCASVPSDGYFTDGQLERFAVGLARLAKRVAALVRTGLWERTPGGYVIRRWLKWNKSASEREREKSKDRERKAAQSPEGFQPELGPESGGTPDGNAAGFPSRAHARTSLHSTSQHNTAVQSQETERGGDEKEADDQLAACGVTMAEVRDKLRPMIVEALAGGVEPLTVKVALSAWHSRGGKPGLLPHLIEEFHGKAKPRVEALPPPCGECGPGRMVELEDDTAARCPRCHPSSLVGVS